MAKSKELTQERLRELLHYCPETGVFTWRVSTSNRAKVGTRAGSLNTVNGYRDIRVDGRLYREHRLAWFYMTGELPETEIDHENTARDDNRWKNLRVATSSQNKANTGLRRDNSSGFKGVIRKRKRWGARLQVNKNYVYLGTFDTPEEAHAAYTRAAEIHFADFARAS